MEYIMGNDTLKIENVIKQCKELCKIKIVILI